MNAKQRRTKNRATQAVHGQRSFTVDWSEVSDRSINVSLSSSEAVNMPGGPEVLSHAPGAIDMSRAAAGLPLLVNHDRTALPAGRITDIKVVDGKLRGNVRIDESRDDILGLVSRGTLTDTSISYLINNSKRDSRGNRVVTSWTPYEASFVSVPMDPSVGVGRSFDEPTEGETMPHDENTGEGAQIEERERMLAITDAFAPFAGRKGFAEKQREFLENGTELDAVKWITSQLAATETENQTPVGEQRGHVHAGADAADKFRDGAIKALSTRSGLSDDPINDNEFSSFSMKDLARRSLELGGVSLRGLNDSQLVERAISPGTANTTTATFTHVLEAVVNKGVFNGFSEFPSTWQEWCSVGSTPDFRQFSRPGLSHFDDLAVVAENGSYTDGSFADKKETATPDKRGRVFSITREAILADDTSQFSTAAVRLGGAGARSIDQAVYTKLAANDVMVEDGLALFVAGHNNLNEGTAGAPDTTRIKAAYTAMRKQTDQNSVKLDIRGQYLIGPVDLAHDLDEITEAEYDPAGTAGTLTPNRVKRLGLVPIHTAHLTDTNDWYMAGPKGTTVEVVFVQGQRSPVLERENGWLVDALHWKVRMEFGVIVLDWRALQKNAPA